MKEKLLVINGRSYGEALVGLGEIVYDPSILYTEPDSVKLVMFTGGADITPSYYGHTSPNGYCYSNGARDKTEKDLFDRIQECGLRSIGICRGVQFLNVMAGGTMFHHVENHEGCSHNMSTFLGEKFIVNSLHHQMVIPPDDAFVIGWSSEHRSSVYYGDEDDLVEVPDKEPEAVLFPSINALGVQYHPEIMAPHSRGYKWFWELARDAIKLSNFDDLSAKYTKPMTLETTG